MPNPDSSGTFTTQVTSLRQAVASVFVGQDEVLDQVLCALLAEGHILVESCPGLGKTLLVRCIARALGLSQNRIQFTPDLLPADITGTHVFDPGERRFVFQPGPVFTQFLLADELNRSPAKTHAALLEAMQEGQVTLDGKRYPLPRPFLVMATQNPIESEGTYPLPEAALDRFTIKIHLDYPPLDGELAILRLHRDGGVDLDALVERVPVVLTAPELESLRAAARAVVISEDILRYAAELVRASRSAAGFILGASPRAAVALLSLARAAALIAGREYVIPDDLRDLLLPCLRHRVMLSPEAQIEGRSVDALLTELMREVPPPTV